VPEPTRIAVVAYEVGERGGEERVLAETVRRTHERIRWVVVSAGLDTALRPLVDWRRVPAPAAPFRARLGAMLALGGARLAATRAELVHVSGPLLLNRVDLASVHFLRAAFYESIGAELTPVTRAHLALERLALSRARALLVPSLFMKRELDRRFPGKPVFVVPNGVDLARYCPDPADRAAVRAELAVPGERLVALFAGHGWTRKGLVPAVEALALARSRGADAELWVVGEGDPGRYGAIAEANGVRPHVRFLGPRSDLDRLFRGADVLVLPSSFETFGLVVLEAAASGVPAIATRTGVVEELTADGEGGMIVDREPEQIATALTALAHDPDRLAAMGRAARRRAEAYTWERSIDALLGVYERLLARRK
jgi:glycosyltransferase involved in cell wall biosynthesis